ncbi:MAG TPA: MBL fold metallo-hydrolase [Solirubrobacteraceae bacterium]|nr:MBL fold metallo-hydrolase [Solirubrobacteraceae bacterium]
MRAVSLHRDVIVATSRVWATNCTIVRGAVAGADGAETFVVDSPVLPDELELLPALLGQAGFAEPSGLLATHGDWDHLLAPLAFPQTPLGCAESTSERIAAEPGDAQRKLRGFDETFYVERPRPLALGALQALPVPGRCEIGSQELELHPTAGHVRDGMALLAPWAGVLIAGDYLSPVEIPTLAGGDLDGYRETLERLRGLVGRCEHVVPGHGPVLTSARALEVLEQDLVYLQALSSEGHDAKLPRVQRSAEQRRMHAQNVEALSSRGS